MKKLLLAISIATLLSCNNNNSTKNNRQDTTQGSDVSNATPVQGDTSSYERMSNRIDTSHHH